jgi:hypothetical protein
MNMLRGSTPGAMWEELEQHTDQEQVDESFSILSESQHQSHLEIAEGYSSCFP